MSQQPTYIRPAPIKGMNVKIPEEYLNPLESPSIVNAYTINGALEGAKGYTELLATFPNANPVMEGIQFGDSSGNLHLAFCTTKELVEYNSGDTWSLRSGAIDLNGDDSNPIFMAPVGGLSTENLYITNGVDAIKVWSGSGNWADLTTTGYTTLLAKCLIGFKGHLVLGNTTEDGTVHPFRIRWSVQSDPTDWAGTTSGFLNLIQDKDNSKIQSILPHKEALMVYKETAISRLDYRGGVGSVYFRETPTMADSGAISPKAIAPIPDLDVHLVVTQSNIELFDGFSWVKRGIREGFGDRIRKEFFNDINWQYRGKVFAASIPDKRHVMIGLPTGASTTINRWYIYDWDEDAWFRREFTDDGYSVIYVNNFFTDRKALLGINSNVMNLYDGNNENGTAISRTWRTKKLNMSDLDPALTHKIKTTNRQEFDYSGSAPTIKMAGAYNSEDTLTFGTGQTVSDTGSGVARTTVRDSGKYLSLQVSQTIDEAPTRVAKYTIYYVDRESKI